MKTYLDCYGCFVKQSLKIARKTGCDDVLQKVILDEVLKTLIECDGELPPPLIAEKIENIIHTLTKCVDPYKEIKKWSNDEALKLYLQLKEILQNSSDKLTTAIKLSAFGNLIDFAIVEKIDLNSELERYVYLLLKGQSIDIFASRLAKAESLLIIGDNAGEIVFDKILVEYLADEYPKLEIFYSVRHSPVINDATTEDARYIGLDKICKVISSGLAAPGTVLERCSNKFQKIFNSVHLIISKGQGNYETMSNIKDERLFYLLKVKCEVVSRHLGFDIGNIVLAHAKNN
ncbi:DUF89 family protein [Candidatus Dependentiae bacterium]|nr:DUF89 family protein [Candidatus Dependentiae bacterium]